MVTELEFPATINIARIMLRIEYVSKINNIIYIKILYAEEMIKYMILYTIKELMKLHFAQSNFYRWRN